MTFFHSSRVFSFLVVFRWAALLPAVLTWSDHKGQSLVAPLALLLLAVLANTMISLFNRELNQFVLRYPAALGVDLLFCTGLLAMSGGAYSPYYLYALTPLLAGAFFFQIRGAVMASLVFTLVYLIGDAPRSLAASDSVFWITQLAGIWLIPILIAYLSILLQDIRRGNEEVSKARDELVQEHQDLARAHRQLEIIHDLTMMLQAAPDLIAVQQRVLGAVTVDLGFSKSVVALVDPTRGELGGWLVYPAEASFPAAQPLPLKPESGAILRALIARKAFRTNDEVLVQQTDLNHWLRQTKWFVIPLHLREHPVGVLLVDESGLTEERESSLMTVANQAALALGTTILCIDRARRLAVETERNRIARDIHDTVVQSLFGIVYSLDACINMLPVQANEVKNELIELRSLANSAHEEVRRSVFDLWPSALTIETFIVDLRNYVHSCCRPRSFSIIFNHHGNFNSLSPGLRRTIYRMAQEALANSARHSGANAARLCLTIAEHEVFLDISDEGRGFDSAAILSRSQSREHFGLQGLQERARALGGDCQIASQPNAGTRIMVNLPINGHAYV